MRGGVTFAGSLGGELSPKVVDLFLRLSRASSVVAGGEDDGHLGHDSPPHRAVDRTVGIRRHCVLSFHSTQVVDSVRTNSSISQRPKSSVAMRPSKSTSISRRDKQKSPRQRRREKTRTPTRRPQPRRAHHRYLYIPERHLIVESHQEGGGSLGAQRSATGSRRRADPMRRRHEPLQPPILRPPPRTPSRVVGIGTLHRHVPQPSALRGPRNQSHSFRARHARCRCLPACLSACDEKAASQRGWTVCDRVWRPSGGTGCLPFWQLGTVQDIERIPNGRSTRRGVVRPAGRLLPCLPCFRGLDFDTEVLGVRGISPFTIVVLRRNCIAVCLEL